MLKKCIRVLVACSFVTLGAAAVAANQGSLNNRTVMTFSQPVEVPGKVLPAGSYTFELHDSPSNRHLIEIFDQEGTKLITTVFAVPNYRAKQSEDTIVKFAEVPAGQPQAIRVWYYPGETVGHELVYSKTRARELAALSNSSVPAVDDSAYSASKPDASADMVTMGPDRTEKPYQNQTPTTQSGTSTSGTSGQSGTTTSGTTGQSGTTTSGTTGQSGTSTSGTTGQTGTSTSGTTGQSGTSTSGTTGQSGTSTSGTTGQSGTSTSGTTGQSGTMTSGQSGTSTSGTSGTSTSGTRTRNQSGTSGTSGQSGMSGMSGTSGQSGTSTSGTRNQSGRNQSGTSTTGTSGSDPASRDSSASSNRDALPHTASTLPLMALFGVMALISGLVLRRSAQSSER